MHQPFRNLVGFGLFPRVIVGYCVIFCTAVPIAALCNRAPLRFCTAIFNNCKAVAPKERPITNRLYAISNRHARKASTVIERRRTNPLYTIRYSYTRKIRAIIERIAKNISARNGYCFQCRRNIELTICRRACA